MNIQDPADDASSRGSDTDKPHAWDNKVKLENNVGTNSKSLSEASQYLISSSRSSD